MYSIYYDGHVKINLEEVNKCLYGTYKVVKLKYVIYYSCDDKMINELFKIDIDKAIKNTFRKRVFWNRRWEWNRFFW